MTRQEGIVNNAPIWLYQIVLPDATVLRLTEWDENLTVGGFEFLRYPIAHGGVSENTEGEIQPLTITMSCVNRDIIAYVESNDGLRGCQVIIWQTDIENLEAYHQDIFFIDGISYGEETLSIQLKGKADLLDVQIPCKKYARNYCSATYKGRGCWHYTWVYDAVYGMHKKVFAMQEGFVLGDPDSCAKTHAECTRHNNQNWYGGFLSVPGNRFSVQ